MPLKSVKKSISYAYTCSHLHVYLPGRAILGQGEIIAACFQGMYPFIEKE